MGIENESGGGEASGLDISSAVAGIADDLGFADSGAAGLETGAEEIVAELPEDGLATPEVPEDGEAAPADETAKLPEPPKTWRKEALEHWATIPDTVRAEILKREEDMFRGLESYRAAAQTGRQLQELLAPFSAGIQQAGVDPLVYVGNLLNLDASLSQGTPEQRFDLINRVAQAYGVDLYEAFGAQRPYVDPQVANLQRELQSLQSQMQSRQQVESRQQRAQAEQAVNTFASDPANVYFDEVAPEMLQLINATPGITLQQAYDKACRLNDGVWAKIQAAEAQKKAEAAASKAAQHAAQARKAASVTVPSTSRRGSGTAPVGTMEDTLTQTLNAIRGRNQ